MNDPRLIEALRAFSEQAMKLSGFPGLQPFAGALVVARALIREADEKLARDAHPLIRKEDARLAREAKDASR